MKAGNYKSCSRPHERHFCKMLTVANSLIQQIWNEIQQIECLLYAMLWAEFPTSGDWRTLKTLRWRDNPGVIVCCGLKPIWQLVIEEYWDFQGTIKLTDSHSGAARKHLVQWKEWSINQPRTMSISCSLGKLDFALTLLCSLIPWTMIRINWGLTEGEQKLAKPRTLTSGSVCVNFRAYKS